MANIITNLNLIHKGSTDVIYALIRRLSDGYVWDGTSFVVWNDSNISVYAIELTNQGGDLFIADFPSTIERGTVVVISYFLQENVNPNINDIILASYIASWNGTSVESPSNPISGNYIPNSREELRTYILTKLGDPVIEINVANTQIETCIDEAIQKFQYYHSDGTELIYLAHQLTSSDITNKYIDNIDESIMSISKVYPVYFGLSSWNMFNAEYQIALNDLYSLRTSTQMLDYYLYKRHISMIENLMTGLTPSRFNMYKRRLYIDGNWNKFTEGMFLLIQGYKYLYPEDFTNIYGNEYLREYATALVKKQWGSNCKKFEGIQLPGGVTLNGQKIYDEAVEEIKELEQNLANRFEYPPEFIEG